MEANLIERILACKALGEAATQIKAKLEEHAGLSVGDRIALGDEGISVVRASVRLGAAECEQVIRAIREQHASAVPHFLAPSITQERIKSAVNHVNAAHRGAGLLAEAAMAEKAAAAGTGGTLQIKISDARVEAAVATIEAALAELYPIQDLMCEALA